MLVADTEASFLSSELHPSSSPVCFKFQSAAVDKTPIIAAAFLSPSVFNILYLKSNNFCPNEHLLFFYRNHVEPQAFTASSLEIKDRIYCTAHIKMTSGLILIYPTWKDVNRISDTNCQLCSSNKMSWRPLTAQISANLYSPSCFTSLQWNPASRMKNIDAKLHRPSAEMAVANLWPLWTLSVRLGH